MVKTEIDIKEELLERIKKYISEGRFKDLNDFFEKASELMLYSEDKKEEFMKLVKGDMVK